MFDEPGAPVDADGHVGRMEDDALAAESFVCLFSAAVRAPAIPGRVPQDLHHRVVVLLHH
jgi:hypothetical protein